VSYDPNRAEESGKAHKKVKQLFEQKRSDILSAMSEFADIAQKGRDALVSGRKGELHSLINANFDLRDGIFNISEENRRMISVARSAGASAKFAGSGGAIVGTYEDEAQYKRLSSVLAEIGCKTIKPLIVESDEVETGDDGVWRNS
jgi:glucuronokinase